MSIFENLYERLENKLLFGSSKQSSFVTEVKNLFKGEEADSNVIWQGLNGPEGEENASFYCMQLFNSLNHLEQKKHLAPYEEKMFATLLALEFYKNNIPKSPELIQSGQKFAENKVFGHSKWVINYFLRTNENLDFAEFYMSRLVFAPVKFNWEKNITEQIMQEIRESEEYSRKLRENGENQENEFARIKRISYPQPNETEPRSLTYGYACFIDYIKKNNLILTREEYEHMKELLSAYMHAIDDEPFLFEFLSVIIHLIKNCIKFFGCPYEDILKEMVVWANQIRLMPGKISIMGENFFHILIKELKVKGSTFRKKIVEDFPYVEKKEAEFTSKDFFFVTSSEDFVSQNNVICLVDLRKSLIVHILKVSEIEQDEIDEIADILDNLEGSEVFSFFEKAMKVVEVTESLESYDKIREVQKQSIEKLIKLIREKAKKKIFEHDFENKSNSGGSEFIFKRPKRWEAYQTIKAHPMGIFEFPEYKIAHIALKEFLDPKSSLSFNSIVKKHRETYPEDSYYFSSNKLPIIFYGKRDEFFRFIRPFGEYFEKVDISQQVSFKIYYLSKPNLASRPSIASYIGYNDILYRRTAMNAFKEKLLFPHLEPNSKNRDTFPVIMINKCLHSYLRDAKHVLPLHLHKCTIRRLGIKNNILEEPVFFSEAVTFGVFTEAENIKIGKVIDPNRSQEKYYSKELVEIIASKLKKLPHYTLSMEVEYLETISDEFITKKEEFIRVDDIQICNSPREYFLGKKPIPSKPILEMTMLLASNSKLFRKEISNPDNFKKKRQLPDILLAFQDLLVEKTIKRAKIENLAKDKPLRILIDGVLFEGVDSLIIEPALTLDGRSISLPIQTFLPIS